MDAVKFIMAKNRMCKTKLACEDCLIKQHNLTCDFIGDITNAEVGEVVEIVEQWDKEHPVKTYKNDFLEKFPNVQMYGDNIDIHWCDIYNKGKCKYETSCTEMCELCWNEPMED